MKREYDRMREAILEILRDGSGFCAAWLRQSS